MKKIIVAMLVIILVLPLFLIPMACAQVSTDIYEPDNSFSQYSSITVTTSLQSQSRSIYPAGDNDYIRFQAAPGTYTFYTTGSTDTYGYLYNSNQNQLAADDDSNGNGQFRISYTITSSGYYFLRVKGYSSSTTGSYTLYYSYVPSTATPPPTTTPTGRITVVSPNGGENWPIGSIQTIRWTSSGITGNVRIELSTDGGTTWTTLFTNTADDGSELWVVANSLTTRAIIRVVSLANTAIYDASDSTFLITMPDLLNANLLNVRISDVATSSRCAYFKLETPTYGDVIQQLRNELQSIIGPGLRTIYLNTITVRIETLSGIQMMIIPLTKQLNIGQEAAFFVIGQIANLIPLGGLVWDLLERVYTVYSNLDEITPVNVYEFTNSYRSSSIDTVVTNLLNKKDKYLVNLKSAAQQTSWSVSFSIVVKYSIDYTGTLVTGYPPARELTWTRSVTLDITE